MAIQAVRPPERPDFSYRHLVVPLTVEVESETAMELAAELAAEDGSTITAVHVIEIPPNLPLDCHMLDEERDARSVLEEARLIAERRGVRVHTRLMRAREAGEAIVAETQAVEADVVVLRAPRAGERRRKVFGRTVDYVLKHADCRVLVAAPPAP
jgi:nucleotide-binding universal stress UspA family protein